MEYLDILKYAMDKEIEARDMYTRLVKSNIDIHSKQALELLSAEEEKHFSTIKAFTEVLPEERKHINIEESSEAEKIWQDYHKNLENIKEKIFPHADELTVLQEAIDMEKEARDFYIREQESITDPDVKKLFETLAKAEQRHFDYVTRLLETASTFYEEFPETRPQL